jgi:hypothetical protein
VRLDKDEQGRAAMLHKLEVAHDLALADVLADARTNAPKRTGQFASSLQARRTGANGGLTSGLAQAGAVERGANVGPRRGPHMRGSHVMVDAGRKWPDRMTARLRGA